MREKFSSLFQVGDRATMAKRPRDRMNALIEREDTAEAVQALEPIAFYDLYHAVGPGDAMMLLEYASSEQFQTCLDLDIWRGDEMSDEAMAPWVEALLAVPDEKFAEFWKNIDPEVMGLYLRRNVTLYVSEDRNDEVEIPDEDAKNVAQSPDFTYWIAYPEDSDKAELLRQLIDRMYAVLGIDSSWSTLAAMNFEMASDLEENAYRFRTERLREYGFMPRDEAAAIFSTVDVYREAEAIRKDTSAELYVASYPRMEKIDDALVAIDSTAASDCYFSQMISRLSNREMIRTQLVAIAQQIAIYDGYQPHETQGFEDSMILAVSYVNIGLEYASNREDEVALRVLTHIPLRRLVSLGYSLTIELQRKAKILVSRGHLSIIEDQKLSLLTTVQRDAVEGMLLERPRPLATALTPYISMRDVHDSAATIADVATRELFFGEALHKTKDDISLLAYTHELVQGVENVNFDNLAMTVLTRRYLKCDEPWGVFFDDALPVREDVKKAISVEEIRSLFKSNLNETTMAALERFSRQLVASLDDLWPEKAPKPDPKLMSALVIATRDI